VRSRDSVHHVGEQTRQCGNVSGMIRAYSHVQVNVRPNGRASGDTSGTVTHDGAQLAYFTRAESMAGSCSPASGS
jgi:hypothetical protein